MRERRLPVPSSRRSFAGRGLAGFVLFALVGVAFGACGGGDDAEATPGGPALDDKAYLAVLCDGLTKYYTALNNEPKAAGISKVIKDYADSMEKVSPPPDLVTWNVSFVKYLRGVVDDPTRALTQSPPQPEDKARQRLADQVKDVPECKVQTFLGEPKRQ